MTSYMVSYNHTYVYHTSIHVYTHTSIHTYTIQAYIRVFHMVGVHSPSATTFYVSMYSQELLRQATEELERPASLAMCGKVIFMPPGLFCMDDQ